MCGAIRVNPWSVTNLADGMREALGMSVEEQIWRHEKHWKYVSKNTVGFWAQSYVSELERVTQDLSSLICYRMGLGLDTFKMVSLDKNFRKLETIALHNVYKRYGDLGKFILNSCHSCVLECTSQSLAEYYTTSKTGSIAFYLMLLWVIRLPEPFTTSLLKVALDSMQI